ncbi:MAG: serine hydrolase [Blastocatellia bacterium]|nr:serine hydrolase [Blastocatellia bacterium]MCS7157431.1 serine hydrolase [Blastocatellia bacterium]MCX7752605.1 serine hydrolase [Blastocatellia bacterium]MDW8168336.1 serine hydrolase [Acidobacteriota bacterium]MDW8255532.1 serine hydrolase [Acidobacteriota bacterium]
MRRLDLRAGALVALILLTNARGVAQDIVSKIEAYMNAHVRANRFSGAILVAREGKVIVSKGYGWANLEHEVPNTPQTKFRLGSITKQFTAMAILMLEERGRLSVHDPVCRYVPNCPEAWREITIHHLLTHTSGIPNFTNFPEYVKTQCLGEPAPPASTLDRFRDKPLDFRPGERASYSNSGYIVLGYIIEKVAGEPYEAFLRKNIFEPLGMVNTGVDSNSRIMRHRAAGYTWQDDALANAPYIDMTIPHAAGGLYSTVEDLYLWDQALHTERLVSKASLEKMFTPFKNNYAYGWVVTTHLNRKMIGHGGRINGFSTFIARYPDERVVVVVLSNLESAPSGRIARDLAAIVFGEPYELPRERVAIALDPRIYDAYVGRYELAPNLVLTVTREDDRLMLQVGGQPPIRMFPESETKFFLRIVDAQITFVKDEKGEVTHLILHQGGQDQVARRVR